MLYMRLLKLLKWRHPIIIVIIQVFGSNGFQNTNSLRDFPPFISWSWLNLDLSGACLRHVQALRRGFSTCNAFSRSGNIKVVYGNSTHPQRSAPQHIPLENLPEILRLEELLCERQPQADFFFGEPSTGRKINGPVTWKHEHPKYLVIDSLDSCSFSCWCL